MFFSEALPKTLCWQMEVHVIDYVDSQFRSSLVPIEEVYNTIGIVDETKMLQYLYDIVLHEERTINEILNIHHQKQVINVDNFILYEYLEGLGISPTNLKQVRMSIHRSIPRYIIRNLNVTIRTLGLDGGYISPFFHKSKVHILTVKGRYLGHVYSWENKNSIGVQGIRISVRVVLSRLLGNKQPRLSLPLIRSTIDLARKLNYPQVKVEKPYLVMKPILTKEGFDNKWIYHL